MNNNTLIIATRGSSLALTQSAILEQLIHAKHPHIRTHMKVIQTQGDRFLDKALSEIGGKGLFIRELEHSVLQGESDLAVHSLKDIPSTEDPRFKIRTLGPREDPSDAFISNTYNTLALLPKHARIGTSSLRRQAQLLHHYPHLSIVPIRGNIHTRIQALDTKHLDGIILASAGLIRLGIPHIIKEQLPLHIMIPAAAQGILAVQYLASNSFIDTLTEDLEDIPSKISASCERRFMKLLEGNCHSPIAAYAEHSNSKLTLHAMIALPDGSELLTEKLTGNPHEALELAETLAHRFLNKGARKILTSS